MTLTGSTRAHWAALVTAAAEPYRQSGRFAWRFARGKLGFDPVFRHLVSQGLIAPGARVLDIGCGQGLLASLLEACNAPSLQGRWPSDWAQAPAAARVTGIELMPREVARAQASLGAAADFVCGDMRHTPFPPADTVVMLDVLHYISPSEQNEVLARARCALPPQGLLLLRVGDAGAKRRFLLSQGVDWLMARLRRHRGLPTSGRSLHDWIAHLEWLGFDVRSQPMSQGTPFANVLLVAKVRHTS